MNCAHCNQPIPTGKHGTPAYKCLIERRGDKPPVSVKVCHACWQACNNASMQARKRETAPLAEKALRLEEDGDILFAA